MSFKDYTCNIELLEIQASGFLSSIHSLPLFLALSLVLIRHHAQFLYNTEKTVNNASCLLSIKTTTTTAQRADIQRSKLELMKVMHVVGIQHSR